MLSLDLTAFLDTAFGLVNSLIPAFSAIWAIPFAFALLAVIGSMLVRGLKSAGV